MGGVLYVCERWSRRNNTKHRDDENMRKRTLTLYIFQQNINLVLTYKLFYF